MILAMYLDQQTLFSDCTHPVRNLLFFFKRQQKLKYNLEVRVYKPSNSVFQKITRISFYFFLTKIIDIWKQSGCTASAHQYVRHLAKRRDYR